MRSIGAMKERLVLDFRRQFIMSDFVRDSLETLEALVDDAIQNVSTGARIGIYGTLEAATVIHLHLLRRGRKNIFFIAKNHGSLEHRNCLVVDIGDEEVLRADVIFTTSLARSNFQQSELLKLGFTGKISCLPDLRHLSVELLRDSSTPKKICGLTGCHQGKPAFVIGNGPSLNQTDPRLIDNSFVRFAGNGIVNLEGFNPDYYFALDQTAISMWADKIKVLKALRLFPAKMKHTVDSMHGFGRPSDIYFPMSYSQGVALEVSSWKHKGFESGHTVVSPMMQFALLMGCRPIFLIGVDVSYGGSNNYFSTEYHPEGTPGYLAWDTDRINQSISRGIERAVKACKQMGVPVFNCAPTQNISIMENLEYKNALMNKSGRR